VSRVRIADLRLSYGAYHVLRGIDLVVDEGALLALLGPSGCGKSTMLQLLAGFQQPSGGEIWVDDQMLSSARMVVPPEQRGISLVFQNYAVWPHKTVGQNVAFGLQIRRLPKMELRRRLTHALRTVRLDHLVDRYPGELSGGQQQRVALARALAVEPRVLLLDEPLSNLDANLREEMRFEIRRMHDTLGITTVYVTHDQSEAMATADQVAVLHRGVLQQVAPPERIFEFPANDFVAAFIGSSNILHGVHAGAGQMRLGETVLRGADHSNACRGDAVALCIRPSRLGVTASGCGTAAQADCNLLEGRVVRSAYLGEQRDVLIGIGGDQTVRALVPPSQRFAPDEAVLVSLPIVDCQILPISPVIQN
jgi:iron(III) transport system ATP-binding protein